MARPKKLVDAQGAKPIKDVQKGTEIKDVKTSETEIKEVTIEVKKPKVQKLQDGDLFLIKVNGNNIYWTKTQINTALQRGKHEIEILKGSSFIPPKGAKCKNCG